MDAKVNKRKEIIKRQFNITVMLSDKHNKDLSVLSMLYVKSNDYNLDNSRFGNRLP